MDVEATIAAAVETAREEGVVGPTDHIEYEVPPETVETVETPVENPETGAEGVEKSATPPEVVAPAAEDPELGPKLRSDGRENKIPYSRVQKITENAVKKALTPLAEALGVSVDAFKPEVLKGQAAKVTALETENKGYRDIEPIMRQEPERFLQMLAQVNPAYAKFLTGSEAAKEAVKQSASTPAEGVSADVGPMPEANVTLADGSKTYDAKGLQELMNWQVKVVTAQTLAAMAPRLEPLERSRVEAERVAAARDLQASVAAKVSAEMARLQAKEGFKENEAEILAVLKANPSMSTDEAYATVMLPKVKGDRAAMEKQLREEIAADMKKRATSTSVSGDSAAAKVPKSSGPMDTEAIIRDAIRKLK